MKALRSLLSLSRSRHCWWAMTRTSWQSPRSPCPSGRGSCWTPTGAIGMSPTSWCVRKTRPCSTEPKLSSGTWVLYTRLERGTTLNYCFLSVIAAPVHVHWEKGLGFKVTIIWRRVFFILRAFCTFRVWGCCLRDTGILWAFWGVCCCQLFPAHIHFTEEAVGALVELQPPSDGPTKPKEQGAH